jgi:hypothetical protein
VEYTSYNVTRIHTKPDVEYTTYNVTKVHEHPDVDYIAANDSKVHANGRSFERKLNNGNNSDISITYNPANISDRARLQYSSNCEFSKCKNKDVKDKCPSSGV